MPLYLARMKHVMGLSQRMKKPVRMNGLAPPARPEQIAKTLGNSNAVASGGNTGGNGGVSVSSIATNLKATLSAQELAELKAML